MRVYIYGTGNNTDLLLRDGLRVEPIGYIETIVQRAEYRGKSVQAISEIQDYDCIIVASMYVNEIFNSLSNKDLDKIVFMSYCKPMCDYDNSSLAKVVLSEKNYNKYVIAYNLVEKSFWNDDREKFLSLNKRINFIPTTETDWPVLGDKYDHSGAVHQYFWQDLWAAKRIHNANPQEHFDIGSRLDGFCSHIVAMGIPLNVIDVRPMPTKIEGISDIIADATRLEFFEDDSIPSLSALCSIEHFGMGRYGDPVDPEACFTCMKAIQAKVKPGGDIYISVPIGRERIEFNAHRIFYASTIVTQFDRCELVEFSCCDKNSIYGDVRLNEYDDDVFYRGTNCRFGLFYFRKNY